jgi:hypothetical protein
MSRERRRLRLSRHQRNRRQSHLGGESWSQEFHYDIWGNLFEVEAVGAPGMDLTPNASNQLEDSLDPDYYDYDADRTPNKDEVLEVMEDFIFLRSIPPAECLNRVKPLVTEMVDEPDDIKLEWLRERRWTAVPTETAVPFFGEDAQRTSQALLELGCKEILAVATEPGPVEWLCLSLPVSREGLSEFATTCALAKYVLTDYNRSFAILCTDEYCIVAGPKQFVTTALGKTVAEARAEWEAFSNDPVYHTGKLKDHGLGELYTRVARRYEGFNGE